MIEERYEIKPGNKAFVRRQLMKGFEGSRDALSVLNALFKDYTHRERIAWSIAEVEIMSDGCRFNPDEGTFLYKSGKYALSVCSKTNQTYGKQHLYNYYYKIWVSEPKATRKRIYLTEGTLTIIAAQDYQYGDHFCFVNSRQDNDTLDLIGAHTDENENPYKADKVMRNMTYPTIDANPKAIYSILDKETGLYVGDIRLIKLDIADCYEIGYVIEKHHRRNHYATDAINAIIKYAFEALQAKQIRLRIYRNNPISRKVAVKIGFQRIDTAYDGYEISGRKIAVDTFVLQR